MRNKNIMSILIALLFILPLTLTGCGSEDKTVGEAAAELIGGNVQAASAISSTQQAPGTVSQETVNKLFTDFEAFEKDLAAGGATLSSSFADCKAKPTVDEQLDCAATLFSTARVAAKVFIDLNPQLQAKIVDLQKQLDETKKELEEAQSRGSTGNNNAGTGSPSNWPSASPWQCLLSNGPLVQWDASKQALYVVYRGKRYYGGVQYSWGKCTDKLASVLGCTVGENTVYNVNTMCTSCHDNGRYANAQCEGGSNRGGDNGGQNNGSGSGSADAEARARAEAEARARAEASVKVDVSVQVQMILVANGVIGGTPIPPGTCMCLMNWDPVCVRLADGRLITFGNSCMAVCAGYTSFVSCTPPTATPIVIDDPLCKMFPSHPDCKKTATPGPTCTATATNTPAGPHPTATVAPPPVSPTPTEAVLPTATATSVACSFSWYAVCANSSVCPRGNVIPKGKAVLVQTIDRDDKARVVSVWLRVQEVNPDDVSTMDKLDAAAKRYTQVDGWVFECPTSALDSVNTTVPEFLAAQLRGQWGVITSGRDGYDKVVPAGYTWRVCHALEDGRGWQKVSGYSPAVGCE